MTEVITEEKLSLTDQLAERGYWPAIAAKYFDEGKYSSVVRLCKEHLEEEPDLVSGRLIYARALYHAGQTESAADQFHRILALDPDHLVALKYLGDIKFASDDTPAAMSHYRTILQIDPHCRGLKSDIKQTKAPVTRTITLVGKAEPSSKKSTTTHREIPFYTETMGDLYLAQGYPQLASAVYRRLFEQNENPRLAEKVAQAEKGTRKKEHH